MRTRFGGLKSEACQSTNRGFKRDAISLKTYSIGQLHCLHIHNENFACFLCGINSGTRASDIDGNPHA